MFNNNFLGRWVGKAYDAIVDRPRRRSLAVDLRHEDKLLLPLDRDKLVSQSRNLRRNHAIVAYAIRKHLDYVSTFRFQSAVPRRKENGPADPEIDALNATMERLFAYWSRPENCDVSGRYTLQRLVRMLEGLAVTEGDAFLYCVSSGKFQIIEGDRVRTPTDLGEYRPDQFDPTQYVHGVKADDSGDPQRYAICDRTGIGNGFVLRELVQAKYVVHHNGYCDRYDQIRGISPISSAMNTFFDLYEAKEYALAKMKLSQLFAVAWKHATAGEDDGTVNLNLNDGPVVADLDPNEDLKFLESSTPSTEFQSFYQTGVMVGLKSLDIPYSFFDESHTNYSGARQALLQYEQAAEAKRAVLQRILTELWVWRLGLFIADGELALPDGYTINDLVFEFVPAGVPWVDPVKDVTADILAVKAGFKSRAQICKENGGNFYAIADQLAAENDYLKAKGLGTDVENITVPLEQLLTATDTKAA